MLKGDLFTELQKTAMYDPGHVNWEAGLTTEEIARFTLQPKEKLVIDRLEFVQKGGGSSTNASIEVRDLGASSTVASVNLGELQEDAGESSVGTTVAIRLSNSTGGPIDANPRLVGYIGTETYI